MPYDPTGNNYWARLTIDLGNDDQYLSALANYATTNWLTTSNPVLDYANAMVASQKTTVSALGNRLAATRRRAGLAQVPPLAPAKLTGSLWLIHSTPNCATFSSSDQNAAANFVETLPPKAPGTTAGMLGYMFWAGGCQGNGTGCTYPPTTCEGGVGVGATTLNIPIPMPALRTITSLRFGYRSQELRDWIYTGDTVNTFAKTCCWRSTRCAPRMAVRSFLTILGVLIGTYHGDRGHFHHRRVGQAIGRRGAAVRHPHTLGLQAAGR